MELTNPLFTVHKLNPESLEKAKQLALAFQQFYDTAHTLVFDGVDSDKPGWEGREWAIVKTKLEEASFFAKKAFASRLGHTTE